MFGCCLYRVSRRTKPGTLGNKPTAELKLESLSPRPAEQREILKSSGDSSCVTAFAGSAKTPFKIPKDQLCRESAYFATSLVWNDNDKTEVYLEEIDQVVFQQIYEWITCGYVRKLKTPTVEDDSTVQDYWQQMVQLYMAADYLMMPKLMNKIVDVDACMHRDYNHKNNATRKQTYVRFWTLQALIEVLKYDISGTPYFNFILDSCVYGLRYGKQNNEKENAQQLALIQELYPEVLIKFTLRSARPEGDNEWNEPNPWFNHFREYHVHAEGEKCGGSLETWTD